MIWIILLIGVVVASVFLALASLSEYQDIPSSDYGLFLIKNPNALDIRDLKNRIFSLEYLARGKDRALVIFGKRSALESFKNLDLLELDDYSSNVEEKNCLCFEVKKNKDKITGLGLLNSLILKDQEQVITQIVFHSHRDLFQANIRILILASELDRRTELAKNIDSKIKASGLSREPRAHGVFESFRRRSLRPKEIGKMLIDSNELLALFR